MVYPFLRSLRHRSLLGVDIEDSTQSMDPGRGYLRDTMYGVLEAALETGGVAAAYRDPYLDRGDGVFTLVHPVDEVPKTVLLDTVVPAIAALLAEHNTGSPERAFRLRVVVHAGEVTYDEKGCYGDALDVAFRLLGADPVKKMLVATNAPMVLVVSDEIHRCVVRHGYEGIDPDAFTRLVARRVSGLVRAGWARPIDAPWALHRRDDGLVVRMEDCRRQA